jgi:hypothetical protein
LPLQNIPGKSLVIMNSSTPVYETMISAILNTIDGSEACSTVTMNRPSHFHVNYERIIISGKGMNFTHL